MVIYLGKQHESKKISLNIFANKLSSITKKGQIESPSLVLDNWWNLGLTFDLSVWIRWGSPIQVVKLDDGHGEGDGHRRDDQVTFGKEKREKQK